jgi:ketosteroid isomerase-like protein
MSEENRELVSRAIEAWNRRDVEEFLACFDPNCEVVFPPEVPEPGPFHGRDELRQWVEGFLAAWESHHADVVETIDTDEGLFASLHMVGRGSGSAIEMDETDAHLFAIEEDRIVRWRNFQTRAQALEAAGLAE